MWWEERRVSLTSSNLSCLGHRLTTGPLSIILTMFDKEMYLSSSMTFSIHLSSVIPWSENKTTFISSLIFFSWERQGCVSEAQDRINISQKCWKKHQLHLDSAVEVLESLVQRAYGTLDLWRSRTVMMTFYIDLLIIYGSHICFITPVWNTPAFIK